MTLSHYMRRTAQWRRRPGALLGDLAFPDNSAASYRHPCLCGKPPPVQFCRLPNLDMRSIQTQSGPWHLARPTAIPTNHGRREGQHCSSIVTRQKRLPRVIPSSPSRRYLHASGSWEGPTAGQKAVVVATPAAACAPREVGDARPKRASRLCRTLQDPALPSAISVPERLP